MLFSAILSNESYCLVFFFANINQLQSRLPQLVRDKRPLPRSLVAIVINAIAIIFVLIYVSLFSYRCSLYHSHKCNKNNKATATTTVMTYLPLPVVVVSDQASLTEPGALLVMQLQLCVFMKCVSVS